MNNSILVDVKTQLGYTEEANPYDQDIIIDINTALSALRQIGVGPEEGFLVTDSTQTWGDLIKDKFELLVSAKSYVFLKVRLMFDPPSNATIIKSMQDNLKEIFKWYDTNKSKMILHKNTKTTVEFILDKIKTILG